MYVIKPFFETSFAYVVITANLSRYGCRFSTFSFGVLPYDLVGRDSSVGAATHYGLDGPGIETRWG